MSTFVILLCNEDNQYAYVDEGRETLSVGETWAFSGDGGQLICGTVVETSTVPPNYSAVAQYEGCGDCLSATTLYFTANTIYNECVICEGTSTTVSVPHPTWTDNYGNVVVQGNAVLLGGNGLNA
jgi:hypothetical protein